MRDMSLSVGEDSWGRAPRFEPAGDAFMDGRAALRFWRAGEPF
jgi:hypothetical protein